MFWVPNNKLGFSKEAIIDDSGRSVTYGKLWEESENIKKIIKKRSVVFIMCDNSLETLSFYFEVISSGIVPLLLPVFLKADTLHRLVQLYEPGYLWVSKLYGHQLGNCTSILENGGYCLLKTKYKKYPVFDELALLLLTSGSTGNSKVVRLSYHDIRDNTDAAIEVLPINESDRGITTLPMNFTYGLSLPHMHWRIGATILATDRNVADRKFWEFFRKYRATNFEGVPYTYELLKRIGFLEEDFPHLRFITEDGGKMNVGLVEEITRKLKKAEFYMFYGQTEATNFLTFLSCKAEPDRLDSAGLPLRDWKPEIKEPNELGVGEVVFQTSSASLGYAVSKDELILDDMNHGIIHTGDLGKIDKNGFIYLVGRKSRFIKLLGVRISLDDIEEMARQLMPDISCACSGEDDKLTLYYTNPCVDANQMCSLIAEKINVNRRLVFAMYIPEIPRTSSGKVDYGNLNKRLLYVGNGEKM